jgi:hypothetical protein
MGKYALISNNTVINIIVTDSLEEANKVGNAIEYTDENPAYVGGKYDPETNKFLPLVTEEVVVENA